MRMARYSRLSFAVAAALFVIGCNSSPTLPKELIAARQEIRDDLSVLERTDKGSRTEAIVMLSAFRPVLERVAAMPAEARMISAVTTAREGNLWTFHKAIRFAPDIHARVGLHYPGSGNGHLEIRSISVENSGPNEFLIKLALGGAIAAQLNGHFDPGIGGGVGFNVGVSGVANGNLEMKGRLEVDQDGKLVVSPTLGPGNFQTRATAGLGLLGEFNRDFPVSVPSLPMSSFAVALPVLKTFKINILGRENTYTLQVKDPSVAVSNGAILTSASLFLQ